MNNTLITTVQQWANISHEQAEKLLTISKHVMIQQGDCFIKAGEIPRKFGFNLQGLFRYYYADPKGNEFTKSFVVEKNFISSYTAMVQQTESYYSIEALETSSLLVISYNKWKELVRSDITWEILIKNLLEAAYRKKEQREKEFLLDDATARLKNFLREYPDIYHRIKEYHIASYLGITPVGLSRIKKKLHINIG